MEKMEQELPIDYEKKAKIEDGFIHFMNFLFVDYDFEKARAYMSDTFVWQDVFHKQKITSKPAFETYYKGELKQRNISLQLKKLNANTKDGMDYLQGEADMIYFEKGILKNQAVTIYILGNPKTAIFLEVRLLNRDSVQY